MKKKLVSLLLVIAIMVTSVSMGFGAISAFAAPAGEGIEKINAFELTGGSGTSTNATVKATIRSKNANYKIKVNSITAYVVYENDADTTRTVTFPLTGSGDELICGTTAKDFTATVSLDSGKAGLIRYECNYDLLDANGNAIVDSNGIVLYKGMTGIGYGAVSANGDQTGATGSGTGEPGTKKPYYYNKFYQINSYYVQVPSFSLQYETETTWQAGGTGSKTSDPYVESGTAPSTLTFSRITWPGVGAFSGSKTNSGTWCTLTSPPSGYYNFKVFVYSPNSDDLHASVEMYYREDTHKNSASTTYKNALAEGLEKSYYTEASWNNYIKALDKVALVALAYPNNNYTFQVACQTAADLTNAKNALSTERQNLELVKADWTKVIEEYAKYFKEINGNTSVFLSDDWNSELVETYSKGATTLGETTTTPRYTQEAIDSYTEWMNAKPYADFKADSIYRYEQEKVDYYEKEIGNRFKNLELADTDYTYLNIALAEYEENRTKHENEKNGWYTALTWAVYEAAANNAKDLLSRNLKTDSQGDINDCLQLMVEAKNHLDLVPADTTELQALIALANEIKAEYNAGNLLTGLKDFATVWNYCFDETDGKYVVANKVSNYTVDKQAEVDAAAKELEIAISNLARYRILNTKELQAAVAKKPEKEKSMYVTASYNLWNSLRADGYDFIDMANPELGAVTKTYADYEEMMQLVAAINNAYDSLELKLANFEALNALVASISVTYKLDDYKEEFVDPIKDLVASIDYGTTIDKQGEVDNIETALEAALKKLTYENYKDANYDKVDAAIERANALDRTLYKAESLSVVDAAVAAANTDESRSKKIIEQDEVDAMAEAINDAINKLEYVPANYEGVEAAIARAEEYKVNEHWYSNFYRVDAAIAAVDYTKNYDEQDEVDAMAKAINDAIDNLIEADANYSGVNAAIADYNACAPLSDYVAETLAPVDALINSIDWKVKAKNQSEVDKMAADIREAMEGMQLKKAEYAALEYTISTAESLDSTKYVNYSVVTEAIKNVNWDLNCRQVEEMQQEIKKIQDAVAQLELYPANYDAVDAAIAEAINAYTYSAYPYTPESIAAVDAVIASVDRNLKIDDQAIVDGYVIKIQNAVDGLTYIRADYEELDALLDEYRNLDRNLYASLLAIDAYVSKIDMNVTIDKQDVVEEYEVGLRNMLDSLEYAPADYSEVNYQIKNFNEIDTNLYEAKDVAKVSAEIDKVIYGLKMNEQDKVDAMAKAIEDALKELKTKMKKADLTDLLEAIAAANARVAEMQATDHRIDTDTLRTLNRYIGLADSYNADTTINKQSEIDELTANIIVATANLEFVFEILLKAPLVMDGSGYIYGFEEGSDSKDARELIDFVGAAELKIYETRNGFGTGTMVQFISTKDGSILGTYTVVVFGDANGDAVIDTFDDAYLAELVNEGISGSGMYLMALDLDKSGYIDADDLTIMTSLANLDYTLKQDGSMERY